MSDLDPNRRLSQAIHDKSLPGVRSALEHGASLTDPIANGNPALHATARDGSSDILRYLLDQGASLTLHNRCGQLALHVAARWNHAGMVTLLLEKHKTQRIPFDVRDDEGNTPLLSALGSNGRGDTIQLFVDAGSDLDATNNHDQTPLILAAAKGPREIAHFLALPPRNDSSYRSEKTKREARLRARDHRGQTALLAVFEGASIHRSALANVTLLVEAGADVDGKRDPMGLYSYHETPLHRSVTDDDWVPVTQFLDHGADPEIRDKEERTPLHIASRKHVFPNPCHVATLLAGGAKKDARDKDGNTPLHLAAREEDSMTGVIRGLLGLNHDMLEMKNNEGQTPLWLSARSGVNSRILLEAGAKVEAVGPRGWTPLHACASYAHYTKVEPFLEYNAEIEARTQRGETPLHRASESGSATMVDALLRAGAKARVKDHGGNTPLDLATKRSHVPGMVTRLTQAEVGEMAPEALRIAGNVPEEVTRLILTFL